MFTFFEQKNHLHFFLQVAFVLLCHEVSSENYRNRRADTSRFYGTLCGAGYKKMFSNFQSITIFFIFALILHLFTLEKNKSFIPFLTVL